MRPLQAEHIVAVARTTLDTADFCFLTTQGESEPTSTRLMRHLKPDADLTVWFGTSLASRKVREIRRNPRLTVACLDPQRPAYAVLVGTVRRGAHGAVAVLLAGGLADVLAGRAFRSRLRPATVHVRAGRGAELRCRYCTGAIRLARGGGGP
jgi:Pyridoxamine 5'-phosphate oxidase